MEKNLEQKIVENIRKIMKEKNMTQAKMAEYVGTTESQFSKMLSGNSEFHLRHLECSARNLSMREIDIITYPHVYVEKGKTEPESVEAVLQIKLKKDKKDQVLKLIFGDNDIEILNK